MEESSAGCKMSRAAFGMQVYSVSRHTTLEIVVQVATCVRRKEEINESWLSGEKLNLEHSAKSDGRIRTHRKMKNSVLRTVQYQLLCWRRRSGTSAVARFVRRGTGAIFKTIVELKY